MIKKIIHTASSIMSWISGLSIFAIGILTFANVIGRYFLSAPIKGTQEICELLMTVVLYFALPHAVYRRKLIIVDAITNRLRPKAKIVLSGVCSLLYFVLAGLFAWKLIGTGLSYMEADKYTSVLKIKYWPFYLSTAFACIMICVEAILDAVERFFEARRSTGEEAFKA